MDFEGNIIKRFRLHTASILAVDVDTGSDFIASASQDGEFHV